ncbi:MAG: nucleotidyltransferase family protein [Ignavibacteria bacterium]|nr:nucleotidyltransferase family protein [Ignavibacteria bacterium]
MKNLSKYNSEKLANYCRENKISKLAVFGSYAKNSYTGESDFDLLIEFEEGKKPGYLTIARIQRELSKLFGKNVDLRTPEEISKYFREDIVKEAVIQYAAQ